jgi:hypothetical protein
MQGFAYLISTFKEPERIVRLVHRIATEQDHVYVHLDKKIGKKNLALWQKYIEKNCEDVNIKVTSTTVVNWGSFGLTESTLKAIEYFSDFDYSYFINLSGDCYPLKTKEKIKAELDGKNVGYMRYWKMPYKYWYKQGMNRIHNHYIPIRYPKYPYVKFLRIPRLRKSVPCGLQPYGGTNWFCLPKNQAEYLVNFTEQNIEVKKFYKTTFAPGEMFFVTVMLNSPFKEQIVNDDKRLINWAEGNSIGNPGIYRVKHYDELIKSDKLFARKFNAKIDSKILDMLDQASL